MVDLSPAPLDALYTFLDCSEQEYDHATDILTVL